MIKKENEKQLLAKEQDYHELQSQLDEKNKKINALKEDIKHM